ncbi:hypothetical protein PROPEN_00309 [Proteus penneri ATCC 35198]|nr:hypothetical protein PROPEN_00309 [Proteus penneri ATCC 35198]
MIARLIGKQMNIVLRLKLVSFLQFFIWGSWLVTFASYLFGELHFKGSDVGLIFSALGLASLIAPVIMGFIADKINNRKLVFITLHIFFRISISVNVANDNSNHPILCDFVALVVLYA